MIFKRVFDLVLSLFILLFIVIPMFLVWIVNSIHLKSNGLFFQKRIGQFGKPFTIIKFKTLRPGQNRISAWCTFLRKHKIDELPQLINIIKGDMSFVGPRPDLPGYYDKLTGESKLILNLKPGLTSEASLFYINEEYMISTEKRSKKYVIDLIYLNKIKMNLNYYYNRSFKMDIYIIFKTFFKVLMPEDDYSKK